MLNESPQRPSFDKVLTPERLRYALALASDLESRGEIVSAQLVRDLVARVRKAIEERSVA